MQCGAWHFALCLLLRLLHAEFGESVFAQSDELVVEFEQLLDVDDGESSWASSDVGEFIGEQKSERSELDVGDGLDS